MAKRCGRGPSALRNAGLRTGTSFGPRPVPGRSGYGAWPSWSV